MALNFVVSYTFTPGTTISSSQVNTNTSDVANVFTGLEAETKTLAKLKVDIDPTLALEVATKQYVDHYATWRRPVLQYASGTVVNIETGIDGTSGEARICFPDGSVRTDSVVGRINCNLAQVAALSGSWQSGLRTGAVANNTWYAIYAVKTTDDATKFVTVADTVLPVQASFSTLNSNFGSNGWVYLGLIRNGDQGSTATGILKFAQSGNMTIFYSLPTGFNFGSGAGVLLATTAAATTLTYTYSTGTSGAVLPSVITLAQWDFTGNTFMRFQNSAAGYNFVLTNAGSTGIYRVWGVAAEGGKVVMNSSTTADIFISGFVDGVLGVGSNPQM